MSSKLKKKRGAPSKYEKTIPNLRQIEKMAEKGFTNMEFADALGIAHSTFDNYLSQHDDLMGAVKRGRDKADKLVEQSLFQRAIGYKHKAVKIMQFQGDPVKVDYVEHYPPDTMAGMYWLNNRKHREWKQKQTVETVDGANKPLSIQVGTNAEAVSLAVAIQSAEGSQ